MKSNKVFWGLFFVLAVVYVVVSKFGVLPDIGVFSIILTVFLIWMFIEGARKLNFYDIIPCFISMDLQTSEQLMFIMFRGKRGLIRRKMHIKEAAVKLYFCSSFFMCFKKSNLKRVQIPCCNPEPESGQVLPCSLNKRQ